MNRNHISITREVPTQSIAVLLLVSLLAWTVGFSVFTLSHADAAELMNISDTMSESRVSQASNHNIVFQVSSTFAVGGIFTITFPSGNPGFTGGVGYADIDLNFGSSTAFNASTSVFTSASGTTLGGATAPGQWSVASSSGVYTFTSPAANNSHIPTNGEYIQVLIGTNATTGGTGTNQLSNNTSAGSVRVTVATNAGDSGEAMVVITNGVAMSGSVSSTLQMVVGAVANGVQLYNINAGAAYSTDITTTATTIPWGAMATSSGGAAKQYLAAQSLKVQTNANSGFIVKVRQTQNFQSTAYGANVDFDPFDNNNALTGHAATISPVVWALNSPSYTDDATWGQYGISSDDTDLTLDTGMATDDFGRSTSSVPNGASVLKFAGNFNTSTAPGRNIFAYTGGPIDGLGLSHASGQVNVIYTVQATSLQEAANDYSTTFIYTIVPVY